MKTTNLQITKTFRVGDKEFTSKEEAKTDTLDIISKFGNYPIYYKFFDVVNCKRATFK